MAATASRNSAMADPVEHATFFDGFDGFGGDFCFFCGGAVCVWGFSGCLTTFSASGMFESFPLFRLPADPFWF